MRATHVGLFLGAILGVVLVVSGLGDMLIVALIAAIGWTVAAAITGEIDLGELVDRSSSDRRAGRDR
ncbi:MAG: DUF2273 domain-containing protein [Microthrixaceae bacterium]